MILAIDQGLNNIGICISTYNKEIKQHYTLYNNYNDSDEKRLYYIREELLFLIDYYGIEIILLERITIHNDKNYSGVAKTLMGTGVIKELAYLNNIKIIEYSPKESKKITGKGDADKNFIKSFYKNKINVEELDEHAIDAYMLLDKFFYDYTFE